MDKTTPLDAIRILKEYNEKVIGLVVICRLALAHNLVDDKLASDMQKKLDEVEKLLS